MSGLTRSDLFDAAVGASVAAGLVVITSQIDVAEDERGLDAVAYACLVVAGTSLAFRRRLPGGALMMASAAVGVYAARDYAGGPIWVMPLVAVYSLACCWPRRSTVPVVAVALLTVLVPGLVFHRSGGGPGLIALVYVGWAAAALLLGEAARARHEHMAGLDERARYLEESREQEARRRVAEERLRIARDVHDVVAHALASIALQAGVGDRLAARRRTRWRGSGAPAPTRWVSYAWSWICCAAKTRPSHGIGHRRSRTSTAWSARPEVTAWRCGSRCAAVPIRSRPWSSWPRIGSCRSR
jgi:signal transduction histidine kinase